MYICSIYNRVSLVWLLLTSALFHSLLWEITFDLWPLFEEFSWGIKHSLGIITCNTEDLVVIGLVCVSWSLSYSALFQSDLLPHLQSLYSTHTSALRSRVPLGGTWEHEALVWVGYKLWRWGSTLLGSVLLHVSRLFSSLGRTLSDSQMALHWGGCVPGVWT